MYNKIKEFKNNPKKLEHGDQLSKYSPSVLMHHGVKGQKWGVRRYENYDGSYTQAGLKRYRKSESTYKKAQGKYLDTKERYKAGTKSRAELTNSRIARNTAKRRLNKDYKHLKQDKLADQGKELYSKGVRITSNEKQRTAVALGTTVAAYGAAYALRNSGKQVYIAHGTMPLSVFAPATIAAGGAAVDAILSAKNYRQNKRLRAYYAHTSNY